MVGEEQAGTRKPGPPQQDQSVSIKLETGNGPSELRLATINHLFADISRYNDQFSLGSMMARQLFSFIRLEDEEASTPRGLGNEEEYQQMTASAINAIHGGTLDTIGLSLEPVSGKHATMMGLGEQAGEGEMRINVANRNRFTSFLEVLTPELVESTGLRSNLESLSGVLSQQIFDHYNLQKPGDEMLELFGGLGTIVNQYKRLGMGEAVEGLEVYLIHTRQGDLREFVAIERNSLLAEPGKYFGPADWQKDTTPRGLEERWGNALAILQAAKDNPKAHELYQQLKRHLSECIKIARADTESRSYYTPEAREEMKNILGSTQVLLNAY